MRVSAFRMEKIKQIQNKDFDFSEIIENNKVKVEIFQKDGVIRNNFTYQQHSYLIQSIRFADAKAGAITAANGLIIKFITDFHAINQVAELLFTGSIILIVIGILFSLMVVYPKSLNRKEKGIIYWEHIVNAGKEEYVQTVKNGEVDQLLESAIENNYSQAFILTKKFKKLNLAFTISLTGYLLAFIGIIICLIYKWW